MKCLGCGNSYRTDHYYYSQHGACYFSRSHWFSSFWCFGCGTVTIHERSAVARLLRLKSLGKSSAMKFSHFTLSRYARTPDNDSFDCRFHLTRLIWKCLLLQNRDDDDGERDDLAFQLAVEKFCIADLAFMLIVLGQQCRAIGLERMLVEAVYPSECYYAWDVDRLLGTIGNPQTANAIKQLLPP